MTTQNTYETAFVARQPLFDAELKVWGYHLLYRDSGLAQRAEFSDALEATLKVMAANCVLPADKSRPGKLLLNFPEESILVGAPLALPPVNTVAIVEAVERPPRYYLDALRQLKADGFRLALRLDTPERCTTELALLCDIYIVDFEADDHGRFQRLCQNAAGSQARLMARRIETEEQLELARSLGCTLFQGFFFQRPSTLKLRTLTASEASKLRLFRLLRASTPDFDALTETVEADVSISYRLLRMLNSPAFSFVQKIASIRQAVLMLGWRQMQNWLRLLLLTDLPASEKAVEQAHIAVQRARFLELCAGQTTPMEDGDALFLLGLFSLLDAMLDTPMQEITPHLALDAELQAALCRREGRYAPWLELLQALERGDWRSVEATATNLGLPLASVTTNQQQALESTNTFFLTALD
jgi:c-di-GMP phosphodiesterase